MLHRRNAPHPLPILLSATLIMFAAPAGAQDVAAFVDYLNNFWAFDHGLFVKVEGQRPVAYRAGGNYIAYVAYNDDVKVYRDGKSTVLERSYSIVPTVTDHYLGYTVAGALKVWDGKDLRTLCYNTGGHIVEDSVIGWYDEVNSTLNAYSNGTVTPLEDALANWPVDNWKASDNMLVWVTNIERKFKVFYRGGIYELANLVADVDYKVGRDVVAYQDPGDRGFKVFQHGEVHDVEVFMPTEYQAGMGVVAYLDQTGALKVFQDSKVYTAMDFTPQSWSVMDSLVVIRDQNYLKVFWNGQLHTVTPSYPQELRVSWSTLAFLDDTKNLKVWRNGHTSMALLNRPVRDFMMERGIMVIAADVNTNLVWWKGAIYEP